jgi:hypothetical protein
MELNLQEKQKDLFKTVRQRNVKHVLREAVQHWTTELLPIRENDTLIVPIDPANCVAALFDADGVYVQHSEKYSNSIDWAEGAVFAKFSYMLKPENREKEI